jgi:hypothetical protein
VGGRTAGERGIAERATAAGGPRWRGPWWEKPHSGRKRSCSCSGRGHLRHYRSAAIRHLASPKRRAGESAVRDTEGIDDNQVRQRVQAGRFPQRGVAWWMLMRLSLQATEATAHAIGGRQSPGALALGRGQHLRVAEAWEPGRSATAPAITGARQPRPTSSAPAMRWNPSSGRVLQRSRRPLANRRNVAVRLVSFILAALPEIRR